eukprot:331698-Amorphochlora_amoeboformis.AAC.1
MISEWFILQSSGKKKAADLVDLTTFAIMWTGRAREGLPGSWTAWAGAIAPHAARRKSMEWFLFASDVASLRQRHRDLYAS